MPALKPIEEEEVLNLVPMQLGGLSPRSVLKPKRKWRTPWALILAFRDYLENKELERMYARCHAHYAKLNMTEEEIMEDAVQLVKQVRREMREEQEAKMRKRQKR